MKNILALIMLFIYGGVFFYLGTLNAHSVIIERTAVREVPVSMCEPLPPLHHGKSKYVVNTALFAGAIPIKALRGQK